MISFLMIMILKVITKASGRNLVLQPLSYRYLQKENREEREEAQTGEKKEEKVIVIIVM